MGKKIGIYIWKPLNEEIYCIGEWDPSKEKYNKKSDKENAEIRIKEEIKSKDGTSKYTINDVEILYAKVLNFYNPDNREKSFDKLIHKNLLSLGTIIQVATEFFKNTEYENFNDVLKAAVEKTAANDWKSFNPKRPYNFGPRPGSQDIAINKMLKAVKNGRKKFLLGAKCRFGKTTTSYFFAKNAKFKNILIMSFRPSDTKNAWRVDLATHQAFSEYSFFDQKQIKDWQDCDTPKVLYMSFQKAKISEEEFSSITNVDLLIIDEDHIGAHKEKNRDFVKELQPKFMLMLTGTPDIELLSNEFFDDEYFRFDYIDEQELKHHYDKNIAKYYKDMPKLNLLAFDLSATFVNKIPFDKDGFSWSEFLKVDKETERFIYENYVKKFLDYLSLTISPGEEDEDIAIFIRYKLLHGLWKLPTIDACKAMEALLKEHIFFKNYYIETLPESDKSPRMIEETCKDYGQTIWLTVMKNTVGVTVKSWTYTISLYGSDNSSQTTYIQYIFRAGSPGKDEFYSFDFCPNRILQVVSDMAQARVADGRCDNFNESFNTVLNYLNVFSYKGAGTFKQLNVQDIFRGISENTTLMSCENLLINEVSDLKENYFNEYDGSKIGSLSEQQISSNKELQNLKKEYEEKSKKVNNTSTSIKKDNRDFEKFVIRAFIDIYKWIKYDKGDIISVEDFIQKTRTYSGHYNEYFNYSENFIDALLVLMENSKRKNFAIAVERFSTIKFSYNFTNVSDKIALKMVNKFSNLNDVKYICDLTFSGPGLLQAVQKESSNIIPVIGICNEVCEKQRDALPNRLQRIAEKEFDENVIIIKVNTLNELLKEVKQKVRGEKLDIIMNPPYSKNTHLKILKNVINAFPESEIINLSPIRWLQDSLAEYKKNSDFNNFEDIRNHVEDLDPLDAMDMCDEFDAWVGNLGIYKISNKGDSKNADLRNKIVIKIHKKGLYYKDFDMNKKDGWRVKVAAIYNGGRFGHGGKNAALSGILKLLAFYDGKKDGKPWYKFYNANGTSKFTDEIPYSIKFSSEDECNNFINTMKTTFGRYYFGSLHHDMHVSPQFFLKLDYTRSWSNDDLYKLFDLTTEEIKEIEETMCEL